MSQGVNNYLIMGNQGENARLTVFGRDGKPAAGLVWANPDHREMGTVSDYRAMGYRPVSPKEVETLPGGTWRPESADFGVMFDVDKKADRVTTKGGMVLMYSSEENRKVLLNQQKAMGELFAKRTGKGEQLRGGADNGGASLATEVQESTQSVLAD